MTHEYPSDQGEYGLSSVGYSPGSDIADTIKATNGYAKQGPAASLRPTTRGWSAAAIAFNLTRAARTIASVFHANSHYRDHPAADRGTGPPRQVRQKAGHSPAQGLALAGQLGRAVRNCEPPTPATTWPTSPNRAQPRTLVEHRADQRPPHAISAKTGSATHSQPTNTSAMDPG